MNEPRYCTIKLDKFGVMNLIYPYVFAIAGIFVIGVPVGIVAGIIDTLIIKNGVVVNVAFAIVVVLWVLIALMCIYSFIKVIDDLSKTIDALCIGDNVKLKNIWIVLLLNIVTLGIYKFIYFYGLISRLKDAARKYDEKLVYSKENFLLFIILASVVGLGFVIGGALLIDDVNNLVEISNRENNFDTEEYQNWGLKNKLSIFNKEKNVDAK